MRIDRRTLLVGAALVVAGACRRRRAPLVLGLPPWPANDLFFLAERRGHYEGADVRLVDYASAEQGLKAFRNGVVQLYPCTLDEALVLAGEVVGLRVVFVQDDSHGADAIVAGAAVSSLDDLRGRRVGYEATALGAYVLSRALELGGMGVGDVVPVYVQVDEHERAFREGRVDAVITYEPSLSRLVAAEGRVIFDSTRIPGEIVDVLVTREDTLGRATGDVRRVARGWLAAAEEIRAAPAAAAAILGPRMGLAEPEVVGAFRGIRLASAEENLSMLAGPTPALAATAHRLAETMARNGFLAKVPDLDVLLDDRVVVGLAGAAAP